MNRVGYQKGLNRASKFTDLLAFWRLWRHNGVIAESGSTRQTTMMKEMSCSSPANSSIQDTHATRRLYLADTRFTAELRLWDELAHRN